MKLVDAVGDTPLTEIDTGVDRPTIRSLAKLEGTILGQWSGSARTLDDRGAEDAARCDPGWAPSSRRAATPASRWP
jgi:hypothetical protein